jgi:type II secretory pathway component GspD/PulD (secretin)
VTQQTSPTSRRGTPPARPRRLRAALPGLALLIALLASGLAASSAAAMQPERRPAPVDRDEAAAERNRARLERQAIEPIAGDAAEPEGERPAPPAAPPAVNLDDENCSIEFSETAEPMELTALVDFVANTLGINISIRGELKGSVLFNTAREVPCERLLPLLDAMLEQNDFSITFDRESGFYLIQPRANIPVVFGDDLASTKLIEIPTITPSSLSDPINQILGSAGAAGGSAGGVSYVDELGLIVITNTPRQIARVEALIAQILDRLDRMTLTPIELRYISAPSARERLISLVGGDAQTGAGGAAAIANRLNRQGGNPQTPQIGPAGAGSLENMAQRLALDPQSNALLFRGTDDELQRVLEYVALIDVENKLKAKRHFVGSAARQLAEFAKQRGLGEVIILDDTTQGGQFGGSRNVGFQQQQNNPLLQGQTESVAGPTLVVDVRNGEIVYYGTADQQDVLAEMISTLDTEADRVVIRQYKLDHAVAEEVAEVITPCSPATPGSGRATCSRRAAASAPSSRCSATSGGSDGEIGGGLDPTQVFVVADTPNNQIIVKAPVKQQEDMAQLIERLDLRRRQVFLEALIVSVSDTETSASRSTRSSRSGSSGGRPTSGSPSPGRASSTAATRSRRWGPDRGADQERVPAVRDQRDQERDGRADPLQAPAARQRQRGGDDRLDRAAAHDEPEPGRQLDHHEFPGLRGRGNDADRHARHLRGGLPPPRLHDRVLELHRDRVGRHPPAQEQPERRRQRHHAHRHDHRRRRHHRRQRPGHRRQGPAARRHPDHRPALQRHPAEQVVEPALHLHHAQDPRRPRLPRPPPADPGPAVRRRDRPGPPPLEPIAIDRFDSPDAD